MLLFSLCAFLMLYLVNLAAFFLIQAIWINPIPLLNSPIAWSTMVSGCVLNPGGDVPMNIPVIFTLASINHQRLLFIKWIISH